MTSRPRPLAHPMHRGAIASPVLLLLASVVVTACIQSVARGAPSAAPSGVADSDFAAGPSAPPPTGPTPIPSFVRPTPTPAPTFLVYVVKAGDNLDRIARRFGTTGRSIAYWNRGTYPSLDPEAAGYSPNLVKVGWTLMLIPKVILDEQTLGQPTPNPTDPSEATASPSY